MLFWPTKEDRIQTSLQDGDVIHVSVKGRVVILRPHENQFIPLILVEDSQASDRHFCVRKRGRDVGHEYASFVAQVLASIAGLYVKNNHNLLPEGHYSFLVTRIAPETS
jgi:hypothetical protein